MIKNPIKSNHAQCFACYVLACLADRVAVYSPVFGIFSGLCDSRGFLKGLEA